jgi:hypothetical protein
MGHPSVRALLETPAAELARRRAVIQAAAYDAGLDAYAVADVLNARPDLPRPLLREERETLLAILRFADFPGRDALVAQVEWTRVVSYCGCGCATVGLEVDQDTSGTATAVQLTHDG